MLTPVDVQNKAFKGGIGFDKKDVETFMSELSSDYGMLYRSNVELKDKVTTLNESLQHYRSIEDSMQKALTLSEKTAEETINSANDKARQITIEAEKKAEALLADAKEELLQTKNEIFRLQQQHAKFKEQFTRVLESQLKIMDGEMIDIDLGADFEGDSFSDSGFGNFSGGGLGSEGGLGGLGGGGGYAGSGSDGFERTNQDPAFNRGTTLNMDPFADAMNGGGRFSKQTGGAYNGSTSKKKTSSQKSDNKASLNVKSGNNKVKQSFNSTTNAEKRTTASAAKAAVNIKASTNEAAKVSPEPLKPKADTSAMNAAKDASTIKHSSNVFSSATDTHNTEAAASAVKPQTSNTAANTVHTASPIPEKKASPAEDTLQVTGEVEDRVNESNMLDSEDNYSTGFDFVEDDSAASFEAHEVVPDTGNFFDDDTVTGEVEDRVNESNMLDSEDNYNTGFDFVSEDFTTEETYSSPASANLEETAPDEDTYSGEVEDKINEATMLDSEDNYSDGFDFVVGNDEEEEIPTIFSDNASTLSGGLSSGLNSVQSGDGVFGSSQAENSTGLNIDPFHESEDVLVGDVEDNVKQSNLIGNADDEEEGFNFL